MPPPPHRRPPTEPSWPFPKFNIRVDDLAHPGATIFFDSVHPTTALRDAVVASFKWLYTEDTAPRNVKAILLVLRPMEGVAYTFGTESDKEIHFSLDHIKNSAARAREEILGVLTHEVVHCYQYNALGTCPGGLIEGVADFVRLKSSLAPPHWKRSGDGEWDAGYDRTAYFLEWIEDRYGQGSVQAINQGMKDTEYHKKVFKDVTKVSVKDLWDMYCAHLRGNPTEASPSGFCEGLTQFMSTVCHGFASSKVMTRGNIGQCKGAMQAIEGTQSFMRSIRKNR